MDRMKTAVDKALQDIRDSRTALVGTLAVRYAERKGITVEEIMDDEENLEMRCSEGKEEFFYKGEVMFTIFPLDIRSADGSLINMIAQWKYKEGE